MLFEAPANNQRGAEDDCGRGSVATLTNYKHQNKGGRMQKVKETIVIAAAIAALVSLLIVDGRSGAEACEGDKYNQATGQCVGR